MNITFPDSNSSSSKTDNQQPLRTANTSAAPLATNTDALQGSGAEVSLSGATVQALKAQLATVPSVRQERVQSLQKAVENGTYKPSSQQIAAAMHEDLFGAPSNTGS